MDFLSLFREMVTSLLLKVVWCCVGLALKTSDSVLVLFDGKLNFVELDKEDANTSVVFGIEAAELFFQQLEVSLKVGNSSIPHLDFDEIPSVLTFFGRFAPDDCVRQAGSPISSHYCLKILAILTGDGNTDPSAGVICILVKDWLCQSIQGGFLHASPSP
jgi:hypothetical protein